MSALADRFQLKNMRAKNHEARKTKASKNVLKKIIAHHHKKNLRSALDLFKRERNDF